MVRVRARPACGSVVVLLTLTVLGLGAGCTSAAESTTTPVPPETYCATSHLDGGFVILNADRLALNGQRDTARELYTSVLGSASATDTAKRCAASGLAQIALTEPSETAVGSAANDWNTFTTNYLGPFWGLLLPFLLIVAALLALAKAATRLLVAPSAVGPRQQGQERSAAWMYAFFGILPIAVSAALVTLALPRATSWNAVTGSVVLTAADFLLVIAAGIALRLRTTSDPFANPLGDGDWDPRHPSRPVLGAFALAAVAVLGLLGALGTVTIWYSFPAVLITSLLSAAVGVLVVAHLRGVRLDMVIEGRKADGSDDAGKAQAMRAALQAVACTPPRGALTPQNTDVSSLPAAALGILPDGVWAKAASLLISAVGSSKPWRVVVAQLDDETIDVSVLRNGVVAASQVIRPSSYGWPGPARADGDKGGHNEGDKDRAATTATGTAATGTPVADPAPADTDQDLGIAAAAFLTVTLSTRHPSLADGLTGAKNWRSVAGQVVATTSRTASQTQRLTLLTRSVAFDRANTAAEVALLTTKYARSPDSGHRLAEELSLIFERIERTGAGRCPQDNWDGPVRALQLRMLFNMTVALSNAALSPADPHFETRVWRTQQLLARRAAHPNPTLWVDVDWYVSTLTELMTRYTPQLDPGEPDLRLDELVADIRSAAGFIELIVGRALDRPPPTNRPVENSVLAYFESACAFAYLGEWNDALDRLTTAVTADPGGIVWVRLDPSLTAFRQGFPAAGWDSDDSPDTPDTPGFARLRDYRALVGQPGPKEFLDLDEISPYAGQLRARGVRSAEDIAARGPFWLARELALSHAVTSRWVELAGLHEALPAKRRGLTHLFLRADVAGMDDLLRSLSLTGPDAGPPGQETPQDISTLDTLRQKLMDAATDGDLVPPSLEALTELRKRLYRG